MMELSAPNLGIILTKLSRNFWLDPVIRQNSSLLWLQKKESVADVTLVNVNALKSMPHK